MSIKPYNNYSVNDLSGIQQPYINSTTEIGYFGSMLSTNTYNGKWYSLPLFLNTHNGIAMLDVSCGLNILQAGIYKINLGLDFFTADSSGTNLPVYFCFGDKYLTNAVLSGSFGGTHTNKMLSFSSNSTTYPGIISWITNAYNSGATTVSNFDISNNLLLHTYYSNTDPSGTFSKGICTTGITFILNFPTTIYLNTSTPSTKLLMGKSYFTLELIQQLKNFPKATGTYTVDVSNNFYVLTFTGNGTITFYTPLEITIIAVGGGGSGGAGSRPNDKDGYPTNLGGRGGGGGGIGRLTSSILPLSTAFTISVGGGGSASSFKTNSTNYLTATGGKGGSDNTTTGNGNAGSATSDASSNIGITPYGGGAGGFGHYASTSTSPAVGKNSGTINNLIDVNGSKYSFSGGGGGGGSSYGGLAGGLISGSQQLNGTGGAAQGNTLAAGASALANSYGSGGGGGASPSSAGGAGGQGVVIIYFRFSKYD
jgi:hypothetical protein